MKNGKESKKLSVVDTLPYQKPEIPAKELVLSFFEVQNNTLLSCNNCQFGLIGPGLVSSKKRCDKWLRLFVPPLSRSCEQRSVIKQLST